VWPFREFSFPDKGVFQRGDYCVRLAMKCSLSEEKGSFREVTAVLAPLIELFPFRTKGVVQRGDCCVDMAF
ncbi:hypothetical protein AVEN_149510-1, partial [Araneus ventricosus]